MIQGSLLSQPPLIIYIDILQHYSLSLNTPITPENPITMHSHHSHSGQYCTHATGDLETCILEAIRQKFELFCLTEHIPRCRECDLYPQETLPDGNPATLIGLLELFSQYHKHARQLQMKYAGQIDILVGCETEYMRDIDLKVLELLIAKYPIDLMVGSVHHVNSIPIDFDQTTWQKALDSCKDEESFYGRYFDHQYEVLTLFKPQIIGHFDVVLLFAPPQTSLFKYTSVVDKMQRNIDFVVAYNGLFELNSAAFRKGWSSAYPNPEIVKMIQKFGGAFCLSDDSHGPHQIGLNYKRTAQYIREMEITQLGRLACHDGTKHGQFIDGQFKVKAYVSKQYLEDFITWQEGQNMTIQER